MLRTENIRALPAGRSPEQRIVSIAIVAGLHIAVLAAIISALNFKYIPTIQTVTHIFIPAAAPSPPTSPPIGNPIMAVPKEPTPTPPVIINETPQGPIIPLPGGGNAGPSGLPSFGPQPILDTHTVPPYPPFETRLGREGDVLLRLSINADGGIADVAIARSSGHQDFDEAAANWVKAHWRYAPAQKNGVAVASITDAIVKFRLIGLLQ